MLQLHHTPDGHDSGLLHDVQTLLTQERCRDTLKWLASMGGWGRCRQLDIRQWHCDAEGRYPVNSSGRMPHMHFEVYRSLTIHRWL